MVEVLIVAVAVFGFALVSGRLSMSPITAPMVFTAVGVLVGTAGLGWFTQPLGSEAVSLLVETTLVLVLFTDAVRIDLRALRHDAALPSRLLGVGMPLTIVAGTLWGLAVLPGVSLAEAALLAAVLAPTDAALGQAVVSDGRLPVRVRQSLNVESGLNDGIAVPVVTVLLALTVAEEAGGASDWAELAAREVGFGVLCGLVAGLIGGRVLDSRVAAGTVEGIYRQLATISIAVIAYSAASAIGGNGFIAAFTAGLAFGAVARDHCQAAQDFAEDEGELLTAITFVIFGAALLGPVLDELSWPILAYAAGSLTVIRMLPVVLSMVGSGTLWETRLFFGWFGPRGLASILFALLVVEELGDGRGQILFTVACWTVAASIVLHGLTASAWAGHLAARFSGEGASGPEMAPVPELPTRRGLSRPWKAERRLK